MSKHKHNYTQYSEKKQHNPNVNPAEKHTIAEEVLKPISQTTEVKMDSAPVMVNETVETKSLPETVAGMVVGCAKLNVRTEANLFSDIICELNAQSEIEINVNKSTKDWFYICTATGVEGYCMRKYVEAHL